LLSTEVAPEQITAYHAAHLELKESAAQAATRHDGTAPSAKALTP
jgi:hypothetical protein